MTIRIVTTAAALVLLGGAALAQPVEPSFGADPLALLRPHFLIPVFITGLITWAFKLFREKTGIDIDLGQGAKVQTVAANMAGELVQELGKEGVKGLRRGNPKLAEKAREAVRRIPDPVRRFKITEASMEERILAKIPQLPAASPPVVVAAPPKSPGPTASSGIPM